MENVNLLIREKLDKYPEQVKELIMEAMELSSKVQESALSEQLEGVVRRIVKG